MAIDPVSLITGVGSLLGGLFNKPPSAEKQSYGGIMGQARGARDASAQYGFNPLTLLGVSSPLGAGSGPGMGAAISDAMALLADGFSRRSDVGQKEALERENTTLRERLTKQTLQPQVPGVYDRIEQGPMIGANNGVASRQSGPVDRAGGVADNAGDADLLRPLAERLPVDLRREAQHDPVRTHSGLLGIDNPLFPGTLYVPTLDGDEAMSVGELVNLLPMLPQLSYMGGQAVRDGHTVRDQTSRGRTVFRGGDGRLYAQQPDRPRTRYRPPRGLRPEHIYGF